MRKARLRKPRIAEQDLSRWKLVADFQARLAAAASPALEGTFADPRRQLGEEEYLGLLLFGLFNPVVDSMRGLCAASELARVKAEVCTHRVSLGSFSEAQAVIDPALLQKVFNGLAQEAGAWRGDARLERYRESLCAVDSTLWAALPRMSWALWRWQQGRESALRAHFKFNLLEEKPVSVTIAEARRCERAVLREQWRAGEFYVGDRYYGGAYAWPAELRAGGCSFVLRLPQKAVWTVIEEFPLRAEDRAAGVVFDGMVRLGERPAHPPVRLVRVATQGDDLLLVTSETRSELAAELVGLIYSYRWRIELFFKWLKCILGCRHWLAESERGVALQIYCALIAALLLLRYTGRRPGKRAMEMIQWYLTGTATLDELTRSLGARPKKPV